MGSTPTPRAFSRSRKARGTLASSARASYAEAIEVASNFSAMIVNQAIGLLEQAGVENPALVIAPVIESAVDQALSKGHRQIKPEDLIGDA